MISHRTGRWPVLFFCVVLFWGQAVAESVALGQAAPAIAIVIDDLGKQLEPGRRVVALPGPVACAFLPREPYTVALADAAHHSGKEVMLHLPMQPVGDFSAGQEDGVLTLDMTQQQFASALGISVHTLRNWEQGRRTPEGPALALLRIAARHPRVLRENLAESA